MSRTSNGTAPGPWWCTWHSAGLDELRSMDATHLSWIRRLPAAEVSLLTGTFGSSVGIELVH
jgi:hypothetical protein